REAERRAGAHYSHTGQALQVRHQRVGDLILNFLWRATGPIGKHNHLVLRKIRNRINRRAQQGPVTPGGEAQIERDHQAAIAPAEFDESMDHCRSSVVNRKLSVVCPTVDIRYMQLTTDNGPLTDLFNAR